MMAEHRTEEDDRILTDLLIGATALVYDLTTITSRGYAVEALGQRARYGY
jgi:predicted nucleic acid-binding protein